MLATYTKKEMINILLGNTSAPLCPACKYEVAQRAIMIAGVKPSNDDEFIKALQVANEIVINPKPEHSYAFDCTAPLPHLRH
jgi:hypothetical protein